TRWRPSELAPVIIGSQWRPLSARSMSLRKLAIAPQLARFFITACLRVKFYRPMRRAGIQSLLGLSGCADWKRPTRTPTTGAFTFMVLLRKRTLGGLPATAVFG